MEPKEIKKARKVKQARMGDGAKKDQAKKVKQAHRELEKSVDAAIRIQGKCTVM